MANTITAGNGTNNGLAVTSDATGALNILTGSGGGTAAISIDSSQNVTMAANLSVTGNTTITGTITATGGVSGGIRSGTAVASTSGTSIDFTSLPTGLKRITVMFNGVSLSGTSNVQIQIGSGSITNSGYVSGAGVQGNANNTAVNTSTTGFITGGNAAADVRYGVFILYNITGNNWMCSGSAYVTNSIYSTETNGAISLGGTLDRVRITTVNGTDAFDAGSINILFE
jgi:hypothetical protein